MNVIIWGSQVRALKAYEFCKIVGWNVIAFVDNDQMRWEEKFCGLEIISPKRAEREMELKKNIVILMGTGAVEAYEDAVKLGIVIPYQGIGKIYNTIVSKNFPKVSLKNLNLRNCRVLDSRESLLSKFSRDLVMAEIGVSKGDFSKKILEICKPSKLYLIDAWDSERYKNDKEQVMQRFQSEIIQGLVEIRQGNSTNVLESFKDNSLDWVYIDTVHDYEVTWKELLLCDKKVKKDGYICGHDYTQFNIESRVEYGVYAAVNKFAVEFGYELKYLTMEIDGLHSFALKRINGVVEKNL